LTIVKFNYGIKIRRTEFKNYSLNYCSRVFRLKPRTNKQCEADRQRIYDVRVVQVDKHGLGLCQIYMCDDKENLSRMLYQIDDAGQNKLRRMQCGLE